MEGDWCTSSSHHSGARRVATKLVLGVSPTLAKVTTEGRMAIDDLFDLSGRTALVTGASRGIGYAIANGLANAGADIIAVARSTDRLDDLKQSVEQVGRRCNTVVADVSDLTSINGLFAAVRDQDRIPDILVNNAGIEQVAASTDVDEALWDTILDTNLKGAFFVAKAFAKTLLAGGREGSIINMGSLTSAVGVPTATPYTSSKSAILGMTRALASEWAADSIRVNAIGPGYFRTDLTEQFYQDEAWQEAMLNKIPMGRFGRLDDLVGISIFLASPASSYVTGQIFYVDGGYLASI